MFQKTPVLYKQEQKRYNKRTMDMLNALRDNLISFFSGLQPEFRIGDLLAWPLLSDPLATLLPCVTWAVRLLLPFLALLVMLRCGKSLLKGKNEPETWAYLRLSPEIRLPVQHWENIIGRGSRSDLLLNLPTISRAHAALVRDREGEWTVIDIANRNNLLVNGRPLPGRAVVKEGDHLGIAGVDMVLNGISAEEAERQMGSRTVPGRVIRPGRTLTLLTLFMLLLASQLALAKGGEHALAILASFGWLLLLMWLLWTFSLGLRRRGYEVETLGFFLSGLGLAVIASGTPGALFKQTVALTLGLALFLALCWILRDLQRVKALRWPMAGAALGMMGYVLLFGETIFGARNWVEIAGFSFQPSELVKVAFIFAGAATLDRLQARRNLYSFIALSAALVGALALMNDFGTAVIFFVVFLIVAYLRSGDLATIALAVGGAALAGILAVSIRPYIADRFAAWGHVWEYVATSGYQQTRTMSALASGGFFGLGGGQGWLKWVAAADTDLVFGFVAEEWGLIVALAAVSALVIAALSAVKSAHNARSAYYVIAACGAAGLMLFQMLLNVCGSLDLLPLTGVTFPFVSNGGSSLIASWGLLAFLKAADTRQNASFAIRLPRKRRKREQPLGVEENPVPPVDEEAAGSCANCGGPYAAAARR